MNSALEYQLLKPLGVGGMAETFLALRQRADGFEQHVCLKRILPAYARDPLYRKLFVEEARLAARLRHSNIVGVIDYTSSEDELYLVFELIAGCDLRSILRSQPERKLTPQLTILIATELAQGLRHAHGKGIVHRDLSPSNVLISIDGEVKLADFGIAKAMNAATHSGTVKGKIAYMAPEQARAIKVDGRADLFSLGVMMYQCLLGRRPFDGSSEVETLTRVLESNFTRMGEVDHADIPKALSEIVDTLLAHERDERFPNAGDLLERLYDLTPGPGARETLGALAQKIYEPAALSTDPFGEAADKVLAVAAAVADEAAVEPKVEVEVERSLKSTLEDESPLVASTHGPSNPGGLVDTSETAPDPIQNLGANAATPIEGRSSRNKTLLRRALFAIGAGAVLGIGAMVLFSSNLTENPTQHDASPSEGGADHVSPLTNPQAPALEPPSPPEEDSSSIPVPTAGANEAVAVEEPVLEEPVLEAAVDEAAVDETAAESAATTTLASGEERASLTVVVLPFGDVWVDGRHIGSTPARVRLRPGIHSIEAGTESGRVRRSVRLEPGQRRRVTIDRGARQ